MGLLLFLEDLKESRVAASLASALFLRLALAVRHLGMFVGGLRMAMGPC
jgi:hypothetical protein